VTIQIPDGGSPFDGGLVSDRSTLLWLHQTKSRGKSGGGRVLLSAVLLGSRVVRTSPDEQAQFEAHGFGSGRGAVGTTGCEYA